MFGEYARMLEARTYDGDGLGLNSGAERWQFSTTGRDERSRVSKPAIPGARHYPARAARARKTTTAEPAVGDGSWVRRSLRTPVQVALTWPC